jgi:hypothetical protein
VKSSRKDIQTTKLKKTDFTRLEKKEKMKEEMKVPTLK